MPREVWMRLILLEVWARETSVDDAMTEILDGLDEEVDALSSMYERGDER